MARQTIATTRVQFKYETYDYELDKNVTVNVSVPRIKREANKDQILALGEAIATACEYDNGILATYFIQTDDLSY
mgnify:CR=1 FL=1